jgi:simple sugar transport system permease protein
MRRPEFGAFIGAIAVFALFVGFDKSGEFAKLGGFARWTDVASTIGIMGVVVGILMICGEFDLSAGVIVGTSGLTLGMLVTRVHMNLWLAILVTLTLGAMIGFLNGYLVTKTKLPSFVVTLATFFVLRGLNLGFTQLWTGTVRVDGLDQASGYPLAQKVFAASLWFPYQFSVTIFWWLAITILGAWMLTQTKLGNWITAAGGDANAARNCGVPVRQTKIAMFMMVSIIGSLVGIINVIKFNGMQAGQGVGEEFTYIIAAVVGGCLLTGGFGSAIGATIGASIIGIAFIGIAFSGWNTDWNYAFLGTILFAAVSVNTVIRRRAEGSHK